MVGIEVTERCFKVLGSELINSRFNFNYFAENFGAEPRIAIRFDEDAWAFFDPVELYVTPGGNYRVKLETAIAQGEDILELAGESSQFRLDDLKTLA